MSDQIPFIEVKYDEIIIKIHRFSDEDFHQTGIASYHLHAWGCLCDFRVYTKGYHLKSKGHVWISFSISENTLPQIVEYSENCLISSVIDATGNKRFSNTHNLPQMRLIESKKDCPSFISVDRPVELIFLPCISRKTLLEEPLELLADDTLTLHIYFETRLFFTDLDVAIDLYVECSFKTEKSENGKKYSLLLESKVGEKLKQESEVFKRMANTPMIEREAKIMEVQEDEYPYLRIISYILMGTKTIKIGSIHDIYQMYMVGDKYDIPIVIKSCRDFLININRYKNLPHIGILIQMEISCLKELAEKCDDAPLNQIINALLSSNNKENLDNQISDYVEETDWKLVSGEKSLTPHFNFCRSDDQTNNFYT